MRGVTSPAHAQRFLHVHGVIQNLFRGYVAYCVQKLLSRKSGHGTRLLVEVDLLTKE